MLNQLLRPVYRSMVKEDLWALVQLLTKVLKTFDNEGCSTFPFDQVGPPCIIALQKTSDMQPSPMIRSGSGNNCTSRLPCLGDTGG